jgi:hypothetical protein
LTDEPFGVKQSRSPGRPDQAHAVGAAIGHEDLASAPQHHRVGGSDGGEP